MPADTSYRSAAIGQQLVADSPRLIFHRLQTRMNISHCCPLDRPSVLVGVLAGLLYRYPLFRIVRLDEARQERGGTEVSSRSHLPENSGENNFSNRSMRRPMRRTLLKPVAMRTPKSARERYARSLGIGSVYCYFVRGKGQVVAIDESSVAELAGPTTRTNPMCPYSTGLIFGNAIRDGSGLIDVNQFPNSQDFNRISEADQPRSSRTKSCRLSRAGRLGPQ